MTKKRLVHLFFYLRILFFLFFFWRGEGVANSMVEYSAFKCDSIFYTFLWSNCFVHNLGRVCKTTTDPERNEWKKPHVVSIANSKRISFLLDRTIFFVWIREQNWLGLSNKVIELGNSNYRETKNNELLFFLVEWLPHLIGR